MKLLLIGAAALMLAAPALAEKADADKEVKIGARYSSGNLVAQGVEAVGDVVLSKGTILIKAGKATVKVDNEGYHVATFWAEPGSLVTFRQKRDGAADVWVEGEAERVEYTEKQETVKFFSKAKVREVEGTRLLSQASGAHISYDARREQVAAMNQVDGDSKVGGGRVEMILAPRRKPAAAPAPATNPQTK
jgi:lipopolysaccharide export system protein LptA